MKNWQRLRQHPELLDQYLVREQVYVGIRQFFTQQDFHEVETPYLVAHPGTEPYLDFFSTQINLQTDAKDLQKQLYLITSPELQMKKLVVAGLTKVFQLGKSFRNHEGLSSFHNPEFTILEWYRSQANYTDIMTDCEQLMTHLIKMIRGGDGEELIYQNRKLEMSLPWLRISVSAAFQKYAEIGQQTLLDEDLLRAAATKKGYAQAQTATWEEVYNQIFLNEIEPALAQLNRPIFVTDYPLSQAALSKKKTDDPRFAERFELYLGGIELANAFTELTDPIENEQRAQADMRERSRLGKPTYQFDEDYIQALEIGLPPTGGIALGVDRLIMLLADVKSIQETMFFPMEDLINLQ